VKKGGKHFAPEDAADYLGGYLIFNHIAARDIQRLEMKAGLLGLGKGIDTFCPLGPWIVTTDEIPNPQNLAMELRANGDLQNSRSSLVNIPEILSRYFLHGIQSGRHSLGEHCFRRERLERRYQSPPPQGWRCDGV